MRRRTYKFTAADVDCKLCTEFVKKIGCTADACICLPERIEAGVVAYEEALMSILPDDIGFLHRLPGLVRNYQYFCQADHLTRIHELDATLGILRWRNTPQYYAAMYLLTATKELHSRMANCFLDRGIDFKFATIPGISMEGLCLYNAAYQIYSGKENRVIPGIGDAEYLSDPTMTLILNALLISRYGMDVFNLKRRGPNSKWASPPK